MPEPLAVHIGRAAVLAVDHVDTDQIIPSREMRSVGKAGLAEGLFAGWRYSDAGERAPEHDFVLNRPESEGASILVSGENFGCGSSREHAVWALAEYGFKVILARSFGSIFAGNCVRNGILPAVLPAGFLSTIRTGDKVEVDLSSCTVSVGGEHADFEIDAYSQALLLKGQDPIDLALAQKDLIDGFTEEDRQRRPWLYSVT